MKTLSQCLADAQSQGLARIDAQMLLLHACEQDANDRAWLIAHDRDSISPEAAQRFEKFIERRLQNEPVAYIIGFKEFYGLRLKITPDVLDPRDDTEVLVDWALELIPKDKPCMVLDLGTGSGAIALAIKSQRPLAQITATDASQTALKIAATNALRLNLSVRFIQADALNPNWFSSLADEKFDLIVSNPPYIAEGDPHLSSLSHEPILALTSGKSGLQAIENIIKTAPRHLTPQAWLLVEHGYDQANAVSEIFATQFQPIEHRYDLSMQLRCTGGKNSFSIEK